MECSLRRKGVCRGLVGEGEATSLIKQNMIQKVLYSFIIEKLFHKSAKIKKK